MTKLVAAVAVLAFAAGYLLRIGIEHAECDPGDCFCDDCRNKGAI